MSAPRWAARLLTALSDPDRVDEVVGDLEEAHARRLRSRVRPLALLITAFDALDMAAALLRRRRRRSRRFGAMPADGSTSLAAVSWLDVKLSVRMLIKHPGLSAVSWVGMTFGVTLGAAAFGVIHGIMSSELPLDDGQRIVSIRNEAQPASHLHLLDAWRAGTSAFEELGAYRVVARNLITSDGTVAPERVAEMTASGFRIARVPPRLGRVLVDADQTDGAPDVVVIGHGVWRDRFGGAPDVVGRTLQIGATPHTVVGVMPADFAFPIDDRVWTPLRLDAVRFEAGDAPPVEVFARLAPGATIRAAGEQVQGVGQRVFVESRTSVVPYAQGLVSGGLAWGFYLGQTAVTLILIVIAINVAVLVYARTVARASEISIRGALGASRSRIVTQLFTEALLLSGLAAASGLLAATLALEPLELAMLSREGAPFWWDFDLTLEALGYTFVVAVAAAVVIGIVPAIGATGRRLHARLQSAGPGGSRPGLGRTWAALIALQTAGAVAILPVSLSTVLRFATASTPEATYPIDEVLTGRVELDRGRAESFEEDLAAGEDSYEVRLTDLARRLEALPEVTAVAWMGTPPWLDPDLPFEVEGPTAGPLAGTPRATGSASNGHALGRSTVSPEIFDVADLPVLSGRRLTRGDAVEGSPSIVVNRRFEEVVLGGGSAVGRRVRFRRSGGPAPADADRPWYTIVGVIPSFPPHTGIAKPEAKAYLPLLPEHSGLRTIAVRIRGTDAGLFSARLRRLAADVDPMLRLERVETIETMSRRVEAETPVVLATIVGLSTSVLLLAVAGLYALMSFTVVWQRREIGVRMALGARPARVLGGILARAGRQLGLGVAAGLLLAVGFDRLLGGETLGGREAFLLPVVVVLMAGVGVLAAWAPARTGLRIQPTEALRGP